MSDARTQSGRTYYRCDGIDEHSLEPRLFDPAWLHENNLITSQSSQGRGFAAHISFEEQALVLRRYCRGGLVRHFSHDQFVWLGLQRARPYCEFELLREMTRLGLPCPRPYACQVVHSGLYYSGALIMHEIPQAATLADILCRREVSDLEWTAVGACLRRFHDASVYHSDLNANNILLNNEGEVFLIDFDKSCFRRGTGGQWKSATLKRLKRSIMKCRAKADIFYFDPAHWDVLRDGYLAQ
ncbi:MAG: 3-deoxy-D-manno-octulosonic acid kinase [Granulosicoccus sp.]|nr:3-deoxy-D-manno-octulosonic acid kinase [Granulosicoccus sp.]